MLEKICNKKTSYSRHISNRYFLTKRASKQQVFIPTYVLTTLAGSIFGLIGIQTNKICLDKFILPCSLSKILLNQQNNKKESEQSQYQCLQSESHTLSVFNLGIMANQNLSPDADRKTYKDMTVATKSKKNAAEVMIWKLLNLAKSVLFID